MIIDGDLLVSQMNRAYSVILACLNMTALKSRQFAAIGCAHCFTNQALTQGHAHTLTHTLTHTHTHAEAELCAHARRRDATDSPQHTGPPEPSGHGRCAWHWPPPFCHLLHLKPKVRTTRHVGVSAAHRV